VNCNGKLTERQEDGILLASRRVNGGVFLRVYLDNCCFNRPFDEQVQARIRVEAEAKLDIQSRILAKELDLAWSYMVEFENEVNPFDERKNAIENWHTHATVTIEETPDILSKAESLTTLGFKSKDALHVACAISAGCAYFLTTDDEILRRAGSVPDVEILNPTDLLRALDS
jgi:hypothetical protein